jgi:hypothetical protein
MILLATQIEIAIHTGIQNLKANPVSSQHGEQAGETFSVACFLDLPCIHVRSWNVPRSKHFQPAARSFRLWNTHVPSRCRIPVFSVPGGHK